MSKFIVYTDGSYRPPHHGAFGWIALKDRKPFEMYSEYVKDFTISQCELYALYHALKTLPPKSIVDVYSDSMYTVNAFNKWMFTWKKNNWFKDRAQQMPVANKDILEKLYFIRKRHKKIRLRHVKAHQGNVYNEVVDFLVQCRTKTARDGSLLEDHPPVQTPSKKQVVKIKLPRHIEVEIEK